MAHGLAHQPGHRQGIHCYSLTLQVWFCEPQALLGGTPTGATSVSCGALTSCYRVRQPLG
jgi:hypothetical protein